MQQHESIATMNEIQQTADPSHSTCSYTDTLSARKVTVSIYVNITIRAFELLKIQHSLVVFGLPILF